MHCLHENNAIDDLYASSQRSQNAINDLHVNGKNTKKESFFGNRQGGSLKGKND